MPKPKKSRVVEQIATYGHPGAESLVRPEVGTQAQFKKKRPRKTYRYDSSLSPALDWDGQNPSREQGEVLLREILEAEDLSRAKIAAEKLRAMSRPFLNWTGKAERLSFDVPTLPLFIHEWLSTRAILETLKGHERDRQQTLELFGDPQRSIVDQVLRAYEHHGKWVNRMILGDSLVVMNSLLEFEGLGGQVQMIYIDPPYGVKFGSNFQPFVRDRVVSHGDDGDLTREPEMVQAYRDTWELGLHSYLTYMRDRLLLTRELLTSSGSVFVQISDENLHRVRDLMDEVFGAENAVAIIPFRKKTMPLGGKTLEGMCDFLLWYARDLTAIKYRELFIELDIEGASRWVGVELPDGTRRNLSKEEAENHALLPEGARVYRLVSQRAPSFSPSNVFDFTSGGRVFRPPKGGSWVTSLVGMERLAAARRLEAEGENLSFLLFHSDFPFAKLTTLWSDTSGPTEKAYVVQTSTKIIQRCLQMTTDPGDLILDPTCGSGTTAYVAEQWGRRWMTIDTSRVPLALARQRLLTATYPWYELKDEGHGPAGGFVYKRKQNKKGEEVGGVVPHVDLKSIANDEPPREEVLVDRPEEMSSVTRVSGPFVVEATIPTPMHLEEEGGAPAGGATGPVEEYASFVERMLEVLRRSPILRLKGNRTVTFTNVRPPAKTLSLSAEAFVDATAPGQKPSLKDAVIEAEEKNANALALSSKAVAFVFGPENGAVSEKLVFEAAREAHAKSYTHLYVVGFAIQSNAREMVERCEEIAGIPATYVQVTPDLLMGDLLKTMRSSQIFSVCGLPEITPRKLKTGFWEVELLGFDLFDPITMKPEHLNANDVPAWLLDTDYNGMSFHVSQAFFPRTNAWESLRRALKTTYEESVWDHLAGTTSAPFTLGEHSTIAVKVIDDRGNELLVVRKLGEAKK